jgi:radical SAM-linked protein
MRLRITFSKSGALRYTGHLDLHSIWERTARRAGLPLGYTQGFHPGPRLQLASALPLGFSGRAEILDMWLLDEIVASLVPSLGYLPEVFFKECLQASAPPGLILSSVEVVDEHGPALQTQVTSAEYEVTLLESMDGSTLIKNIDLLIEASSLPRERRGKLYDLRPLIESLELLPMVGSGDLRMYIRLTTREGATGRPDEVLDALHISLETTRIERTRLILK